MPERRGALIPGLLLILLGGWLLARNLGLRLPGLAEMWPALLIVLGLASLAQYGLGGRRQEGLVMMGTTVALLGAFFLAITLGPLEWRDLSRLWPVFVLIGGAAFFVQWLAQREERGLLVPAVLALLVGVGALPFTLGRVSPVVVEQLGRLWPLALILVGLGLIARYVLTSARR